MDRDFVSFLTQHSHCFWYAYEGLEQQRPLLDVADYSSPKFLSKFKLNCWEGHFLFLNSAVGEGRDYHSVIKYACVHLCNSHCWESKSSQWIKTIGCTWDMEKHQGKRPSQNHKRIIKGSNNLAKKAKGAVVYKLLIASYMPRPRFKKFSLVRLPVWRSWEGLPLMLGQP